MLFGASAPWAMAWPDAYGPALRVVPGWMHGGRPVVELTLSFGAAAMQGNLFGRAADGRPVGLAEVEGALVVSSAAGAGLVAACWGWDAIALVGRGCPGRD